MVFCHAIHAVYSCFFVCWLLADGKCGYAEYSFRFEYYRCGKFKGNTANNNTRAKRVNNQKTHSKTRHRRNPRHECCSNWRKNGLHIRWRNEETIPQTTKRLQMDNHPQKPTTQRIPKQIHRRRKRKSTIHRQHNRRTNIRNNSPQRTNRQLRNRIRRGTPSKLPLLRQPNCGSLLYWMKNATGML